ncbi:MAG: SpoIID/LytB domain-containing protein [Actinomycetota bacterium]
MRRTLFLTLVLVAVMAVAPAAPGRAEGSFTFYGSGYGHGIGMSQWGAYGLAQEGWDREEILTHFFSGTKIAKYGTPPAFLRVGPVQGKKKIRLIAEEGPVDLLVGDQVNGDLVGTIPEGETWTVRAAGSQYRVLDAAGKRVGGQLWGGVDSHLYAVYAEQGARVKVPESGGHTYNRGYLELNLYGCTDGCVLRLIIVLDPQEYLYGIAEVPSSWPMEALKTQADAARSYAFIKAEAGQHRSGCNCALYASAVDQVYAGWDKEGGTDGDRWVRAVDGTKNEVIKHEGELVQSFYSASSGGYTENNENVWGGNPIPYLRGVCDPGDYTPANTSSVWTVSMTADEVTKDLGLGIGTVVDFTDIERGVSGRIITATVEGANGSATISGITLRSRLGLRDDRVWINADRSVTGQIREKYDDLNCSPGLPTSKQTAVASGLRQKFKMATIYYREGAGAHELSGAILDFYLAQGGPGGALGFPTSDVTTKPNGSTTATFEHGTVTCTPSGSCSQS